MKRAISILVLAAMLITSLVMVLPVSAATPQSTQEIDFTTLSYIMKNSSGEDLTQQEYEAYYTDVITATSLGATGKDGAQKASKFAELDYPITETSHYVLYVEAKNNRTTGVSGGTGYAGLVFAATEAHLPYLAYGALANLRDGTGKENESNLRFVMTDNGSTATLADDFTGSLTLTDDGFGQYKIVYEGLTANVYVMSGSNWVRAGIIPLEAGSTVAIGIYNRDGNASNQRTATIQNARLEVHEELPETEAIDFSALDYVIKDQNGVYDVNKVEDYDVKFTTTATETTLTSASTSAVSNTADSDGRSYFSKLYPITDDSSYVLYFDAKNNRTGGYACFVYASDASDKPYLVYGALNNGMDGKTTHCTLASRYGFYKTPHGDSTVYSAVQTLTPDGYGQYKVVYEGLTATVYTKVDGEWAQVTFGTMSQITLAEGSYVSLGVYNRAGQPASQRTVDIANASIAVVKEGVAVDFTKLDYTIKDRNGVEDVSQDDFDALFTTTKESNLLSFAGTAENDADNSNSSTDDVFAKGYFAKLYPVTANTSYVLYVNAKNNRTGGYSGFVFAADAEGKPYMVYGAINNGKDASNATDYDDLLYSELRPSYGHHGSTITGYSSFNQQQTLTEDGYGQYKIVYEGYTATVYTKVDNEWMQVKFGSVESVTLAEGSYVAVGAYNRHGHGDKQRTTAIANAAVTLINEAKYVNVSFNNNGGSGEMAPETVLEGAYTLPTCTFDAPANKQFKGWATSENGEVIVGGTYNVTTDMMFYAIWEDIPSAEPEDVNLEDKSFVIRDAWGGTSVSADAYNALYTTTVSGSSVTSKAKDGNGNTDSNAKSYFTKLYPITEDTYYTLYVNAKNNRTGGYSGFVFASDISDRPYFVYGALNNGKDNDTGNAVLRLRYGYHSDSGKITGLDGEHVLAQDLSDTYGQYKIVYSGLTATVYTMSGGDWVQVNFGGNGVITLPEGSSVAVGAYNRHGYTAEGEGTTTLANGDRTTNISGVKLAVDAAAPTGSTITLAPNGAEGENVTTTLDGYNYAVPSNPFTAPAHKYFKGWSTSASGSVLSTDNIMVGASTTLYAIWANTQYNVTFNANGGEGEMDGVKSAATAYTLPECAFTAPDHKTFKGWATSAEGEVIGATYEITGDVEFFAIWEDVEYTVTFDTEDDDISGAYGATITLPTPEKDGFTFGGWQIGEDTFDGGDEYTIVGNVTATAIWNEVVDPDPDEPVYSTKLTYTVDETYVIVIPATLEVEGATKPLGISECNLISGNQVRFTAESTWLMNESVAFELVIGENEYTEDGVIASFSTDGTVDLGAKFVGAPPTESGSYRGTVTITTEIVTP